MPETPHQAPPRATPALLALALIAAIGALIWSVDTAVQDERHTALNDRAVQLQQSLQRRLLGEEEHLRMVAETTGRAGLRLPPFQRAAEPHGVGHADVIAITLANANHTIIDANPRDTNAAILGSRIALPEPVRAAERARDTGRLAWTRPYESLQGRPVIAVFAPVHLGEHYLGSVSAVFDATALLHNAMSPELRTELGLQLLLQGGGSVVGSPLPPTEDRLLRATVPLDPPGMGTRIELTQAADSATDPTTLLALLAAVLGLALSTGILTLRSEVNRRRSAEARLQRSEPLSELLIESSPDLLLALNRDGTLAYANRPLPDGPTAGGCAARALGDVAPGTLQAAVRAAATAGRTTTLDHAATEGWAQTRIVPISNAKSDPVALAISTDTTTQHLLTARLRRQQARWKSITRASPDHIALVSLEGRITWHNLSGNEQVPRMSGRSLDELLGKSAAAPGFKAMARAQHTRTPTQFRFELANGDRPSRSYESQVGLVLEGNTPQGFTIITRDVTRRLRGEHDRVLLAAAVEQAAETILVTNVEGIIEYVNPAFERLTGYTRDEAIGQHTRLLSSGRHPDGFYESLWTALKAGRTWTGRFINKSKSGEIFHEEASISPVHGPDGTLTNFVAVKRDVTRESQLEAELQAARTLESVGRLAGGMAHDFNNLLSPILGYAEMLASGLDQTDPRLDDLMEIRGAAVRARELTQQLLAFSRKQVLKLERVDLGEAVVRLQRMLRPALREDLTLALSTPDEQCVVRVDRAQLERVITNLVMNAQDAIAREGRISISVTPVQIDPDSDEAARGMRPGRAACLDVSDNGSGMPEDVLEHIFEPFYTTKPQGKGTGLGLATVHGVIQQHGGVVLVTSEAGRGTRFRILLPEAAEADEAAHAAPPATPSPRGTGTILVVEDEAGVRRLARTILERHGYTVLSDASGAEALARPAEQLAQVDLLLADVVMPEMSGPELAETLQVNLPELAVLFMSGHSKKVTDTHGLSRFKGPLLAKPLSVLSLTDAVAQAMPPRVRPAAEHG